MTVVAPKESKKSSRMISIPEKEYRRLKRREAQFYRIKNHIREAWRTLQLVK